MVEKYQLAIYQLVMCVVYVLFFLSDENAPSH